MLAFLLKGDKFAARAVRAAFMGYSTASKGYVLYDLETKQFFTNRDVIFKEEVFPFQLASAIGSSSSTITDPFYSVVFPDSFISGNDSPSSSSTESTAISSDASLIGAGHSNPSLSPNVLSSPMPCEDTQPNSFLQLNEEIPDEPVPLAPAVEQPEDPSLPDT